MQFGTELRGLREMIAREAVSIAPGSSRIRRMAVLGNHVPRQCGIATFTTDLNEAISGEFPDLDCFVMAMNDGGRHYAYPPPVQFEIPEAELPAYLRAADFLNVNEVEIVSVQHEYGIFGGKAGGHLLALLRELRMPIVTTLHTILEKPNPAQKLVMDELLQLSERIVVMSAQWRCVAAECPRCVREQDRPHSSWNSEFPCSGSKQGPAGCRREVGDSHLRFAVSRQRNRARDRCAAGHSCALSQHRLHRAGSDPSARKSTPTVRSIGSCWRIARNAWVSTRASSFTTVL